MIDETNTVRKYYNYEEDKTICDNCGRTNTEFLVYRKDIPTEHILEKISLKLNLWLRKTLLSYLRGVITEGIEMEFYICQTCVSKGFRGFNKNI